MGLVQFKERRISTRKELTGLLPGRLFVTGDDRDLDCKPTDISEHGLGIISSRELAEGTTIILLVKENPIHLQVAWYRPDFGKHDLFRYGLVAKDQEINLSQIFEEAGCVA